MDSDTQRPLLFPCGCCMALSRSAVASGFPAKGVCHAIKFTGSIDRFSFNIKLTDIPGIATGLFNFYCELNFVVSIGPARPEQTVAVLFLSVSYLLVNEASIYLRPDVFSSTVNCDFPPWSLLTLQYDSIYPPCNDPNRA